MSRTDVPRRKISLLLKFRNYRTREEIEGKDLKDIVVVKRGTKERILIRIVYQSLLASGKVGVHHVREMKKKIEREDYEGGILIGSSFSHSAKKEAINKGIEAISEERIPSFNIFDHEMVPKHEILPKKEAEKLLKKYHVEPYKLPRIKASDPAVFLIGAKRGDILKITRRSLTSGVHVAYRYVV